MFSYLVNNSIMALAILVGVCDVDRTACSCCRLLFANQHGVYSTAWLPPERLPLTSRDEAQPSSYLRLPYLPLVFLPLRSAACVAPSASTIWRTCNLQIPKIRNRFQHRSAKKLFLSCGQNASVLQTLDSRPSLLSHPRSTGLLYSCAAVVLAFSPVGLFQLFACSAFISNIAGLAPLRSRVFALWCISHFAAVGARSNSGSRKVEEHDLSR